MKSKHMCMVRTVLMVAITLCSQQLLFGQDRRRVDTTPAANGVEVNKNGEKGLTLFKGRFIVQDFVISPADVTGSLLMVDNLGQSNEQVTWTKVNPTASNPNPIIQN